MSFKCSFFIFCFSFICINYAQSNNEENRIELSQNISEIDSSWRVVGIGVGYFPQMDDNSFKSPGFSAQLFLEKESLISRFTAGWYAVYRTAFHQSESPNSKYNKGITLGRMFLIYDAIKKSRNNLKLKLGLGLAQIGRSYLVGYTGHFSIHLTHLINKSIKTGISVSLESYNDILLPPIIGLEINF